MIVEIVWAVLALAAIGTELAARRGGSGISNLARLGARIATWPPGRALLWLTWMFLGVHFFTRYTLPR